MFFWPRSFPLLGGHHGLPLLPITTEGLLLGCTPLSLLVTIAATVASGEMIELFLFYVVPTIKHALPLNLTKEKGSSLLMKVNGWCRNKGRAASKTQNDLQQTAWFQTIPVFLKGPSPWRSWLPHCNQVQFPIPIARKAQVISLARYLDQTISQPQEKEKAFFSYFITKPGSWVLTSHVKIHFL